MQALLEANNRHTPAVGMRINASKTNVASALIPGEQRQAVPLDGEPLEDVDKFKYIGSMFVANGQGTEEIRSRINLARPAFSRLQSCLWSRREISLRTKGRVCQAEVRSILLYGCQKENPTLKADLEPLSGPRVLGHARWRKDLVKVSSELAQSRRAWSVSVRDVVNPPRVNADASTST